VEGNKFTLYFYRLVVGMHLHVDRQTRLKMIIRRLCNKNNSVAGEKLFWKNKILTKGM